MAIIKVYKTRLGDNPEAAQLLERLRSYGYKLSDLKIEYVMRVEVSDRASAIADFQQVGGFFHNPVVEEVSGQSWFASKDGPIREVSYKRSVTDPETNSALHAYKTLGVHGVVWVRLSKRYQLCGVDESVADQISARFLYNREVQTLLVPGEEWDTLVPQGKSVPVEWINVQEMSEEQLRQLSKERRLHMRDDQLRAMAEIFQRLGRPARDAEVEMIAAGWSDHCAHTTYKALGLLPAIQRSTTRIHHPLVLSAFVDNSGVMEFYGGYAICFKGETHISPTFAGDPYGGIMTKHGGVIRDVIFTGQGAWPFAGTTILATVNPRTKWEDVPEGAFHPRLVLREAIRGTHEYTNPMGIPMAYSRYLADSSNWKGFALGHSVGLLPSRFAQKGVPVPGDIVLLIGGPTGADGIHGATVSSGKMTSETSVIDAAHVQIGAPIEERKFMEAIPVLRDAGCIRACTDCGAAGLASAAGEIGNDTGIWINLAWVPLKTAGLAPWQILLSESQERGVLAVVPEKVYEALGILDSYDVPAEIIGIFTDNMRFKAVYDPTIAPTSFLRGAQIMENAYTVVDLHYEDLHSACPLPVVEVERQRYPVLHTHGLVEGKRGWISLARFVLGHFNISDQSEVAHRYDQTVQGNTVVPYMHGQVEGWKERMPDEIFVATPVRKQPWGAGLANAVNQFYGNVDPAGMGRLVFVQAVCKLVAAGFHINDITACANVYTPSVLDSPHNAWALSELVKNGYCPASEQLGVPVITGKDSSSGTFTTSSGERIDAPLTLDVLAVGRTPDAGTLVPKVFAEVGDQLILFHPGLVSIGLGGSVLYDLSEASGNQLVQLNLAKVREGYQHYYNLISETGSVLSRSNVAEGGMLRSLFECAIGSGLGCKVQLPDIPGMQVEGDDLGWLFGELSSAIIFSTRTSEWREYLRPEDCTVLGQVTGGIQRIEVIGSKGQPLFEDSPEHLAYYWLTTFAEVIA